MRPRLRQRHALQWEAQHVQVEGDMLPAGLVSALAPALGCRLLRSARPAAGSPQRLQPAAHLPHCRCGGVRGSALLCGWADPCCRALRRWDCRCGRILRCASSRWPACRCPQPRGTRGNRFADEHTV